MFHVEHNTVFGLAMFHVEHWIIRVWNQYSRTTYARVFHWVASRPPEFLRIAGSKVNG
jgi:hypothetical protein